MRVQNIAKVERVHSSTQIKYRNALIYIVLTQAFFKKKHLDNRKERAQLRLGLV